MMKIANTDLFTLVLISSLLLTGCFDEIAFDGSEDQLENLVVQGELALGSPSVVTVSVTQISAFEGAEIPTPVAVSSVVLADQLENTIDLIPATDPGRFYLEIPEDHPTFQVQEGSAYQIRVMLESGTRYESDLEPLLAVPTPESINMAIVEREEVNEFGANEIFSYLRFFVNTPLTSSDNTQKSFLRWELEGCYRFIETVVVQAPIPSARTCYFKEQLNLDKVKVFNGQASSSETLTGYQILETELDSRFSRGYYLTVYQQSLSETAYEYWDKVSQVVERTGSIFEPKPGKILGNISNPEAPEEEVFGYFYTSAQDTIRLYISPEDVNNPSPPCPATNEGQDAIDDICFDCLLRPNSTLVKPEYWEN